MAILIFVEYPEETLLEDRGGKGVGQDNHTVCRVGKRLHLQKTDLVKTPSKQVNNVSVVGHSLRKGLVELVIKLVSKSSCDFVTHFGSALKVFCAITVNVVMRSNRLLQFVTDNHSGSLSSRATSEDHDTCTRVGVRRLQTNQYTVQTSQKL